MILSTTAYASPSAAAGRLGPAVDKATRKGYTVGKVHVNALEDETFFSQIFVAEVEISSADGVVVLPRRRVQFLNIF